MTKILKQIKSEDIEYVYVLITETATIWAICGFVDQANKLLEKLWALGLEHNINDEGFQIIWSLTNKKPHNIPFELYNIDLIQAEHWQRHFQPYWNENKAYTERIAGKDWTELSGNDLKLVGIALAYDENNSNKNSSKDQQLTSLKAITHYLDNSKPLGHDLMNSLICASMLAARNDLRKQAEEFLIKWGHAYKSFWSNTFPSYLLRDIATAKILLDGILAPVFDLTKEKCENEFEEINKALDDRIRRGQSLAYEKLKWKDLLKHISTKAIAHPDYQYIGSNQTKTTLTFDPAEKSEIETAEKRLKVKLPKEYKDFLLASNGFSPHSLTPTLISVDKIDWLKNLDPQLIEIWCSSMNEVDKDFVTSFSNSLLIGGYQEEQQLLLIPSKKSKDWECWFFASWIPGETKYANFRFYMENLLQKLDEEE